MSSVTTLRERVSGWLHREPKVVVPRTVLIVDGNAANRTDSGRLVESLGYRALQTRSAVEALQQLTDQDPDVVLIGFDLDDDVGGLDALLQFRDRAPHLPVVMLVPSVWDTRVAEALRRGAVGYLARPFGRNDLLQLLVRR